MTTLKEYISQKYQVQTAVGTLVFNPEYGSKMYQNSP